ncbi:MAG: YCF48-related protein [Patescibacteria group bacterium]
MQIMSRRPYIISAIVGSLLFVGAGCISFGGETVGTGQTDGGIFKSGDKGDNWAQKVAIPTTTGERKSINQVSISTIVQDPQDPKAIYVGTTANGMFYSYDGGDSWLQPVQISRGRIPGLAVDPKNKCVIYVASENKVLKSEDCSRTWSVKYFDTRVDKVIVAVAVDGYNPKIVWAANNAGDVLKSTDGGQSWANVKHFDSQILKLQVNAGDSRKVYVGTKGSGVWRTDDLGMNWTDLSPEYRKFAGSMDFSDMAMGVSDPKTVVFTSKYGLLRSRDGGDTWSSVDLLTPPTTSVVYYSVALDPKNADNIYYGTSTTFYKSGNGGANWVPKKLPTSRAATAIMVDGQNSSVLYLGVTKFKE